MESLSSIRRKLAKLERCRESFDPAPGFDPYGEIQSQASQILSDEELKLVIRTLSGLKQGRKLDQLNLSMEELAALKAADCSFIAGLQKECERFGITVAQLGERRGLTRPSVIQLKQQYIKKHGAQILSRSRLRRKIAKLF